MGVFTGVPTSVPESASKSWLVGMMNGLMSSFQSWTSYTPTLTSSAQPATCTQRRQKRGQKDPEQFIAECLGLDPETRPLQQTQEYLSN